MEAASLENLTPLSHFPVVLKDHWLKQGTDTERDIQSAIFEDSEKFGKDLGTEDLAHFSRMKEQVRRCLTDQAYTKYFLEIVFDQGGHVLKSMPPSDQPVVFVVQDSCG
jgi:hypothetical protein